MEPNQFMSDNSDMGISPVERQAVVETGESKLIYDMVGGLNHGKVENTKPRFYLSIRPICTPYPATNTLAKLHS